MILMSRDVGLDAKTPVTVRFSALLLSAPDAAPSASAAATLTPFIASSRVVTSSSPFFFLPFSFSAFFAARFASFSAFFAALRASFSSFSFCTFTMSAAASASSFAFFSARRRPSSFASTSPAFSSSASSESTFAAASSPFLGFSNTSSSSKPSGTTFCAVFLRVRFDDPAAASPSSPSSSPSSFSFLRRTRTTFGLPSSPASPGSSSELEYSELTYPSGLFAFSSSVEIPQSSSSSPYVNPDDLAFSSAAAASAATRFSSSSSASLRRRRSSANSTSSSAEPSSAPWLMSAASHSSLPVKMPFFWRSAFAFSSRARRASTLFVFHSRNTSRVTGVPGPLALSFSSSSRSSSWSDLRFIAASRIIATKSALNT